MIGKKFLLIHILTMYVCPVQPYLFPKTDLQLLTVMFRHGDRTPDTSELSQFPLFAANETYLPVGIGQLTNRGKLLMYNNGVMFRKMYDAFLGNLLVDGDIAPYATNIRRTGTSILSFLAGLYPPVKEQQWVEECRLNDTKCKLSKRPKIQNIWNPIPYIYDHQVIDEMIGFKKCPEFFNEIERVEKLPEVQEQIAKQKGLYEYLTRKVGKEINSSADVYFLYGLFLAERRMGRNIPDWAFEVWDEMKESTELFFQIMYRTDKQKQLAAGSLVKRILNSMVNKSEGTLLPNNRKLFIYSGHDISVAPLYAAFGGTNGFVDLTGKSVPVGYPKYGCTFIIELHKLLDTEEYAVKFLFHNFKNDEPLTLRLVDCDVYCPLKHVIELTQNITISRQDQVVACVPGVKI